jgi:hypothetical protein
VIPVADDFSSIARRLKEITTGNPPAETPEAKPVPTEVDYTPSDPDFQPNPYRPGDCW